MHEPHGCGSGDGMYDDLDSLFNPETACISDSDKRSPSDVSDVTKTDNIAMNAPPQSSSISNFALNEDLLKKEEMILYLDLIVTEMDQKKALLNIQTEYGKLKKETDSLRKSLSEKEEKISQLTAENVTLKKNICSLYKTAKSEIDQKDAMLQEANKEIDRLHSHSDKSMFQNEHSVAVSQHQPSTSRISNGPSQNSKQYEAHFKSKKDQNYKDHKRKNNETSESKSSTFTRPSTSSYSSENHSKWNRVNSKRKFPHYELDKHKHLPSHDANNEKYDTYNDKRNKYNKSKSNETCQREEKNPKRQKHCN